MKKNTLVKKALGTVTAGIITAMSICPAWADTSITTYDSTNVVGSYIETGVFQNNTSIYAKGGNINITDLGEFNVINSTADVIVNDTTKKIHAQGKDVGITSADSTIVAGSVIGTHIDTKVKDIKAKAFGFKG